MASNTENLDLLMKNPSTDGADTFNVQTMLNDNWQKIDNNAGTVAQTLANILKPTTPPLIGLPPSTTPDGMFQALGNTGELHVWRKTVVTKEPVPEVPGSYTLGTAQRRLIGTRTTSQTNIQSTIKNISRSNSITVDLEGNVSLDNPSTFSTQIAPWTGSGTIRDVFDDYKYIEFTDTTEGSYCDLGLPRNTVFLVNPDSTFIGAGYGSGEKAYIYDAQEVIGVPGHPYIPAGTTTTYPVSTNPNEYQEGDDAKEAGYVLGDVVNTTLVIAYRQNTVCNFSYSDALYVADDGSISLSNPTSGTAGGSYNGAPTYLSGKFLKFVSISGNGGTTLKEGVIYYIPSNATIKIGSYAGYVDAEIDRYQPVTGYAAIPANTTIEYLGKLGDKARAQIVSYVGTGTYGSKHPTTVAFDIVPKIVFIAENANYLPKIMTIVPSTLGAFGAYLSGGSVYGLISPDVTITGKRISFFSDTSSGYQMNDTGNKYFAIAIG